MLLLRTPAHTRIVRVKFGINTVSSEHLPVEIFKTVHTIHFFIDTISECKRVVKTIKANQAVYEYKHNFTLFQFRYYSIRKGQLAIELTVDTEPKAPVFCVEWNDSYAVATMKRSIDDCAPYTVFSSNFNPKIICSDWLVFRLRMIEKLKIYQ